MKAVICGISGFIGNHLARRLKAEGYTVIGVDRVHPKFQPSVAEDFYLFDLRALKPNDWLFEGADEVYQLAAEVGGLGYIMNHNNDATMLRNSSQINLNVLEACRQQKIPKVFFASSACVYSSLQVEKRDSGQGRTVLTTRQSCVESDVPPLDCDNEYAIEKFFGERLYAAYSRCHGMQVRVARFHNTFGPYGEYDGGREKAPAAICRKVARAADLGDVEVWGDGKQLRSFMYVDDCVEGIRRLMASDYQKPVNIGSAQMVSVDELVSLTARVAGKRVAIKHVPGPVGVLGRNSDNTLCRQVLNWEPSSSLEEGLRKTYPWIAEQVLTSAAA